MKYIIDIEDEYTKDWVNESPMCKELCIPISVPNRQRTYHVITGFKLEPYIEPDRKAIEDEVWENTWKMFLTPEDFGATRGDSYSEAKVKYDEWKELKEDEATMKEVTALAEKIGIHKLYSMVKEIRGE